MYVGKTAEELPLSSRPLPSDPNVLVIGGPITCADVPELCERLRSLLADGDADCVVCEVGALVGDDVAAVDALARFQLTAGRLGCRVLLRHASRELQELLAFVGLDQVVVCAGGL